MTVRIERVEVVCLRDPQADYVRFEGSYQNVLVIVHGDNGLAGIGESDAPPALVKAAIEMAPYNHLSEGLAAILTGQAVDDPRRLWDTMYARTQWHGRRGAAMHAISALDIAIWDLFARSKGVPLHARRWAVHVTDACPPTPPSIPWRTSPRASAPRSRPCWRAASATSRSASSPGGRSPTGCGGT